MKTSMDPAREDLDAAVLRALAPRSVREALRLRWTGGWSVMQVFERLNIEGQAAFGSTDEVLGQRRVIEALRGRLLELARNGHLIRKTAKYSTDFRSKGPRDVLIDLFRLP